MIGTQNDLYIGKYKFVTDDLQHKVDIHLFYCENTSIKQFWVDDEVATFLEHAHGIDVRDGELVYSVSDQPYMMHIYSRQQEIILRRHCTAQEIRILNDEHHLKGWEVWVYNKAGASVCNT